MRFGHSFRTAAAVGFSAWLAACGGGGGSGDTSGAPKQAVDDPPPAEVTRLAQPGSAAQGDAVDLRLASLTPDVHVVAWRGHDGMRHNLWASALTPDSTAWREPVPLETTDADIADDHALVVSRGVHVTAVWTEVGENAQRLVSARFDANASRWTAPETLDDEETGSPRVATDDTGAVLVVYGSGLGRMYDPVAGVWKPREPVARSSYGTGHHDGPVPAMDNRGNALVVFRHSRTGAQWLGSNYYDAATGRWDELPPDAIEALIGPVNGSFVSGYITALHVLPDPARERGNFIAVWQTQTEAAIPRAEVRTAHFTSATRRWSAPRTLLEGDPVAGFRLHRADTTGNGRFTLLWTEPEGGRMALKSLRVTPEGQPCEAPMTVDASVGGHAAQPDLAVLHYGAYAVWQRFDTDDGNAVPQLAGAHIGPPDRWRASVRDLPGGAITSPRVHAGPGGIITGWIQEEGGARRVNVETQNRWP